MTKSLNKQLKSGLFEIQDEIIKSFIGTIGGYYGSIFQEIAKASPSKASSNPKVREAIYNYYQYQRNFSVEIFQHAISTLTEAVQLYPDNAVILSMLGELYLDGIVLGITTVPDPLESGYNCSTEALRIDPFCQHAWYTLTWVYLFKKEKESCFRAGLRCIELNPNYSIMSCGVGFALICIGYFEEGFPIMNEGIKFNLYYPWWVNVGFSLYYIHLQEYSTAYYWAEKINSEETFWQPLLKTVCLSYTDNPSTEKNLIKLLDILPEAKTQLKEIMSTLLLSDELVAQIVFGLEKAGLKLS